MSADGIIYDSRIAKSLWRTEEKIHGRVQGVPTYIY
jgi:hypothetical protein